MDGKRFDDLTRLFGLGTTRRRVVAAALGLAAIAVDGGVASARRSTCRRFGTSCTRGAQCCSGNCNTSRQSPRHLRNRCACAVGEARCNGACVDTISNVVNCGACDVECATERICASGFCVCGGTTTSCNGACIDTDTDEDNCGACGETCAVNGEICVSGACVCDSGLILCDGVCIDTDTDDANCGACGETCETLNGEICEAGTCALSCAEVFEACVIDSDCCDSVVQLCRDSVCKVRNGMPCSPPDQSNQACEDNYCNTIFQCTD